MYECVKMVAALSPQGGVFENVMRLSHSKEREQSALQVLCAELHTLGYHAEAIPIVVGIWPRVRGLSSSNS